MIKLYEFPLSRFSRKVKLVLLRATEGFSVPEAVTVGLVRKIEAKYWRTTMRVRSLVYAAFVFTAGFGFAACTQVWRIMDGPGAGAEVVTCFGERDVTAELNPPVIPATVGRIADPDLCNDLHYHGTVSGAADPNPFGCGWGRVKGVRVEPAPGEECLPGFGPWFGFFGERVALDLMAKNPPDYENAFFAAIEAVDVLESWITKVDEVQLPEHVAGQIVAGQIKDELKVAVFSDRSALAALERLHTNQGREGDETIAVDNLRTALSAKRRVLKLLTEAGLLK